MNKLAVLTIIFLIFNTAACNTEKLLSGNSGQSNSVAQNATTERNSFKPSFESEETSVDQSKLTGTYEFKGGKRANEFKVLQLSDSELKVSFLGNAEFESQVGPMANSGEITPVKIRLKGNKAVLTPEDSPKCRITMTFDGNKLSVKQNDNDCGFPGGVLADGSYKKTSNKPPTFDEEFNNSPSQTTPENQN